jgi:glyoxylase-like metal-dependent hydrolase (beta-lactamase superfamily II)
VRAGEEGFVIDSPVYPDELEALSELSSQTGFPVSGLLATHADWDHLLARLAFPQAALGCAESTAARLRGEPGAAQRELRRFDEEHYVTGRSPLALAEVQELPVPGHLSIGAERELQLHPTGGHTGDGMAILAPWARVLVCGDYLSPVEIPMLSPGGGLAAYAATLTRLGDLLDAVDWVVPGHGEPMDRDRAAQIQAEDLAYIGALQAGNRAPELPQSRRTGRQRQIHADNLKQLAGGG